MKKLGLPKTQRPPKPPKNPDYPTKQQRAFGFLEQFAPDHPAVRVRALLADALYGSDEFRMQAAQTLGGIQVISQLRSNQKGRYWGRSGRVDRYFQSHPGVSQMIQVRGAAPTEVIVGSARRYVEAQARKCFVIALRYPEETEGRYLVASDLSGRTLDSVQAYTLRWWVEVCIEDLKVNEGWGQATQQPGVEGSSRGLTLSLRCDHCLLLHPEQQARVAHGEPLCTIGSLQRPLQMEAFVAWLRAGLDADDFADKLEQLTQALRPLFPLQPSEKAMCSRDLGRLEPTPGLAYRAKIGSANA